MQNENDLKVRAEKIINKSVGDVFRAISEGRLFLNCSADSRNMKLDFRVGGKYHIEFKGHGVTNFGEFLEIVPDQKVVFSWCQDFEEGRNPDSTVTIELTEEGKKTKLVLTHTGFKNKEIRDDHQTGWNGGINDLSAELEQSRIRMLRIFKIPVEKLYEACSRELKEPVQEQVFGQKIILKPKAHFKITLTFEKEEDWGESSIELIGEGFHDEHELMRQRKHWDGVTDELSKKLHSK